MKNPKYKESFILLIATLLTATPVFADVGVPMIFFTLPCMLVALIPIILIEAYILLKKLPITKKDAYLCASLSNITSTLIGIPITWGILVLAQMLTGGDGEIYPFDTLLGKFVSVTWQAPWLLPIDEAISWMVPVAAMVLLVPFFFVSWWLEYFISARYLKKYNRIERSSVKRAVLIGNLITYTLLGIFELVIFISFILFAYYWTKPNTQPLSFNAKAYLNDLPQN